MSTTPHLGLPNDYVDGVTPGSSSVFNFLDGAVDAQMIGSLQAQGAGVYAIPDKTSFTVSTSSGLIAAISTRSRKPSRQTSRNGSCRRSKSALRSGLASAHAAWAASACC